MSKSIVIIVGASSGLGEQFALQIDAHFRKTDEIWLIARRKDKLVKLSRRMRNNTRILEMDITDETKLRELSSLLKQYDCKIRMLVNCAGYGLIGDFTELEYEEQMGMVRLNCEALTRVTHLCIPYMVHGTRIIQMASSAAFMPQPGFAVYAATKAYVHSFTQALRQELKEKGIVLTSVCPGPVDTPFFSIAEKNGQMLAIKSMCLVDSSEVVCKALRDACAKRAVSVYSLPIKGFALITKLIPNNILLPIVRRIKEQN